LELKIFSSIFFGVASSSPRVGIDQVTLLEASYKTHLEWCETDRGIKKLHCPKVISSSFSASPKIV